MIKRICPVVVVLFALLPIIAAAGNASLYEAEVYVTDSSDAARTVAISEAMEQVLIKLSGDRQVAAKSGVAAIIKESTNYAQQYRYRTESPGDSGDEVARQLLWVRFDQSEIDRVMDDAGLSKWGSQRPAVLAWLVIEEPGDIHLLGTDDLSSYPVIVSESASRRGLSVTLPLLDLEDSANIKADDVVGGFRDRILAASQRYGSKAILVGNVTEVNPGSWEGRWTLFLADKPSSWTSAGDSIAVVLDGGIDGTADALASWYASSEDDAGERAAGQLVVEGITNVDQYARVLKYLSTLDPVKQVAVDRVESDRVVFSVVTRGGGEQAIDRAVSLGNILQAEGDGHYRMVGF